MDNRDCDARREYVLECSSCPAYLGYPAAPARQQKYNTQQALTAVEQNHQVIENQNNNTALLVELFERQNKLLANQIKLVQELTNATTTLREAKDDLNAQVRLIINNPLQVTAMVQQFRETFSRGLYTNQTIQGSEILGNVTSIGDEIRKLRGEIVGLIELALNRTAPLPTPTTTNLILPAAMARNKKRT